MNKSMNNKRIIIIGGVAGGASAAGRGRRLCEDCEIIMSECDPHVDNAIPKTSSRGKAP